MTSRKYHVDVLLICGDRPHAGLLCTNCCTRLIMSFIVWAHFNKDELSLASVKLVCYSLKERANLKNLYQG